VYPTGVFKINETPVVFVTKGTPFLVIAQQHNLSLSRLFDFNDLTKSEEAAEDMLVFLQRKRKEGATQFYTVAEGETVHYIAQAAGIRMESLLQYNMLAENAQPAVGEKLYLQQKAPLAPRLATAIKNVFSKGTQEENNYIVHTVQPKETVYSIAKRYAVDMDELLKWNGLEKNDLKTGQQLKINKKTGYASN
jgi:LysM repeat protein